MTTIELPVVDSIFAHDIMKSNKVFFRRSLKDSDTFVILTNNHVHQVDYYKDKGLKVYVWLLEPLGVTPSAYVFIKNNYHKFEKIFTFEKEFLEISDKFILLTYGNCWIDPPDRNIFPKNKNLSMIASDKAWLVGHKLRQEIMNITKLREAADLYGRKVNPIDKKIIALKDYRFSIVIENERKDFYFSEKIIDCFQTGTVPLYWGCPSISTFFDASAILPFSDINQLFELIDSLTPELYASMQEGIKNNFEESKKHIIIEDQFFDFFKNEIGTNHK